MTLLTRIASDVQLMFRRPPRQQYAALCYRLKKKQGEAEMLLLTSRDTGRWVIPKGWPMPGKFSHEVAAREAYEEAGVRGAVEPDSIGSFGYQKGMKDGLKIACRVQVYALEVDELCKSFPEKGERRVEWVSFTEAAKRVNEPELKDLIMAFSKVLEPRFAAKGKKQAAAE